MLYIIYANVRSLCCTTPGTNVICQLYLSYKEKEKKKKKKRYPFVPIYLGMCAHA